MIEGIDSVVGDCLGFFRAVLVVNDFEESKSPSSLKVGIFEYEVNALDVFVHLFYFGPFVKDLNETNRLKAQAFTKFRIKI